MILEKIRELYASRREIAKGNPTGSRFGTCTAQLQQLLYPETSRPEPYSPRALMMFEEGHLIEDWWVRTIDKAFAKVPGFYAGLREEPFYLPVPLEADDIETVRRKIESRVVWGKIQAGFEAPRLWEENGEIRTRLLVCRECDKKGKQHGWPCGKRLGVVLDPDLAIAWAPTQLDRVVRHPTVGIAPVEKKAVSNYQFRRALGGDIDYGKRCQLVGQMLATGLDAAVWLWYRKDTAHLLEIVYARKEDHTRVEFVRSNGQREVFSVKRGAFVTDGGETRDAPPDADWETATLWTPFDEGLAEQIQERIRRVLLVRPEGPWDREYGPDFRCPDCQGSGTQTLRKGSTIPLKTPKPCETCGQAGQLAEVALPQWPCGYCPVTAACWGSAQVRLEVTDKPRYLIRRENYVASGLSFVSPDSSEVSSPLDEVPV